MQHCLDQLSQLIIHFSMQLVTVFMIDIYKPIFNPNLSEEATVKLAKKIGWGFAAFAIIFTPSLMCLAQDFMISDEALQVL